MKNIHILPTDKPSRLSILNSGKLNLGAEIISSSNSRPQNIFFTSDEEIKEGDWVIENHTFKREPYIGKCFYPKNDGTVTDEVLKRDLLSVNYEGHYETLARKHNCKKIILTTDQDLIKDGVQSIDDTFLEWFVKNPSCEFVEVYEVEGKLFAEPTIPKEEPKQETLEEAAKDYIENTMKFSFNSLETKTQANRMLKCIEFGAKWQAKRMYSEEEVIAIVEKSRETGLTAEYLLLTEQFKKK